MKSTIMGFWLLCVTFGNVLVEAIRIAGTDEVDAVRDALANLENFPGVTGDITFAHVYLGSSIIVASVAPDVRLRADDQVWIEFDQQKLHLFDGATEQALAPV